VNKITLVTTSFNQGQFIEDTIKSVLAQDYSSVEYIVVDGGSTDNTLQVLDQYRSQIDVIISEPDHGPADALNKAFNLATGDFFAFLNSDDVCDPTYATELLSCIESSSADLIYSDVRFIDQHGRVITPYSFPIAYAVSVNGPKLLSRTCIIPQQGAVWTRRIFDYGITFNTQNRTCWDLEFFVDALCAGFEFQPISRCLSSFRIHPDSISGQAFFPDLSKISQRENARLVDHSRITSKLTDHGYTCNPIDSYLYKADNLARKMFRFVGGMY
jgi:glycosyltransferase involved in cell wall biosynthesis